MQQQIDCAHQGQEKYRWNCTTPFLRGAGGITMRYREMSYPLNLASISPTAPLTKSAGLSDLTDREKQVLICIARGYSRREIGIALEISKNTAATHIASVYRKLDIGSIAEATHLAIRHGLIPLM